MAVEGGSIGARLRASREKMGLTLLQVAERIHTDAKIVEAIEADNFSALGAPVYARGHIRHYAELVGESADDLTARYSDLSKVGQPDLTQIVKAPSTNDTNKLVAPALLVIAVFAVAGAVWWVSALSKKKPQMSESHVVGQEPPAPAVVPPQTDAMPGRDTGVAPPAAMQPNGAALESAPSGPERGGSTRATPAPARDGSGASSAPKEPTHLGSTPSTPPPRRALPSPAHSGNGVGSPATGQPAAATARVPAIGHEAATGHAEPTSHPAPTASAVPGTRTASVASSNSRAAPASAAGAPSGPVLRAKDESQVTLRYSADSWTEVYDATGARLFYDVGSANSVQTVLGRPPLRVVLGNAAGVTVEFNGHGTPMAKLARPDGSVQFSIDRSGRVIRAKPVPGGG